MAADRSPFVTAWEKPITPATWTLKLQGEDVHDEVNRTELSWPGDADHIPTEARRLLRGIVRQHALERVVTLEATRRRVLVRAGGFRPRRDRRRHRHRDRRRPNRARLSPDRVRDRRRGGGLRPRSSRLSTAWWPPSKRLARDVESEQKFAKALGIASDQRRARRRRKSVAGRPWGRWCNGASAGEFERLLDFDVPLRLEPENPPERAIHQARVGDTSASLRPQDLRPCP